MLVTILAAQHGNIRITLLFKYDLIFFSGTAKVALQC